MTSKFDFGDNNLNQGIFTTMSYNDGWETGPHGNSWSDNYGWTAGPMAFDIAAAQYLYGANTSYNVMNNVYTLPGANAAGTAWIASGMRWHRHDFLWRYTQFVINLTAATLNNSPSGGGMPSYAANIHGGFTIANRVVIENATGGWGVDILTGNAAANMLNGRGGNDILDGRLGGNDRLIGGTGNEPSWSTPFATCWRILPASIW